MHGNLWKWCSDGYGAYSEGLAIDPSGAFAGVRVVRLRSERAVRAFLDGVPAR